LAASEIWRGNGELQKMVEIRSAGEEALNDSVFATIQEAVIVESCRKSGFGRQQRPLIDRGLAGQRAVRDLCNEFAVLADAKLAIACDAADPDSIESPLVKDIEDFPFFVLVRNQQHSFLRLAELDFVCR